MPVVTLLVRTARDPASLANDIRAVVHGVDATLAPEAIMTMEDRLLAGLARPRLYAVLLVGFAGLSLLIAAVGLFGVLSHAVAQQSREIAVRSALGARPFDLVTAVLRQGLAITGAGAIMGLAVAAVLARTLSTLLYGVTPLDPVTFIAVPLLLLVVGGIACVVPARRAARMDPVQVFRSS
ncbi:MAG: putative transport system permease protein [Acidobacteriota bacterium]